MKKVVLFILTAAICMSCVIGMVSCGKGGDSGDSGGESKEVATVDELKEAALRLKTAEIWVNTISSLQLDNWNHQWFEGYFTGSTNFYGNFPEQVENINKINEGRAESKKCLEDAEKILAKGGDSDLYNAVKDYYVKVKNFLSLVSTYPSGYSKFTWSSAVNDCKSECQSAYNTVTLYTKT